MIPFDTLYAFGDSFSDTGASGGPPGTTNGKRTNGGTAVSYLAEYFGNPMALPDDGNIGTRSINFAETGGRVGAPSSRGAASVADQVDDLVRLVGNGSASFDAEDTLFFLAGGLNDSNTPVDDVTEAYEDIVATLVSLGARYIQIALLPAVGPYGPVANALNSAYTALVPQLNDLYGSASIMLSNWGAYFEDIVENPSTYGFTNVTDAFDDDAGPGDDPDTWFFYYRNHPSDAAHQIVADGLIAEAQAIVPLDVPNPAPPPAGLVIDDGAGGITASLSDFEDQNTGSYTLSNGGTTLVQTTNAWTSALIAGGITVTANTVLRFDFSSTDEGEMHGIEFDNDNLPSRAFGFQFYGSGAYYDHQAFNTYSGSGTTTYEIAVGQFFTGDFDRLVFVSDDDTGQGSNSTFSNIELFEADGPPPPPPASQLLIDDGAGGITASLSDFEDQNTGSYTLSNDGTTLVLNTNAWTGASFGGDIVVTANTVLRFDFSSSDQGEIHGIEFDRDGKPTSAHGFQIYGTQTNTYFQDFNTYSGSGTTTYEIAVGQFFTGSFDQLVFISDDDRKRGSNSTFSNIELFETDGPPPPPPPPPATQLLISDAGADLSAFRDQNRGDYSLADGGATLVQTTNAWTGASFGGDIVVTANTVLRFDFSSSDQGEIHGIEFDRDGKPTSAHGFQVYGTQTDTYFQDFNTYSGSGTTTYEIAVGQFFTGTFDQLVFISDNDRRRDTNNSTFSNIELFEADGPLPEPPPPPPTRLLVDDNANGVALSLSAFEDQNRGDYSLTDGGATLVLDTNAWTAAALPAGFTVTEKTMLRFDFSSTDEGEIHGIEFDRDGAPTAAHGFQIYGTQTYYEHQDFNNYSGSGTRSYEIAVGQFFTGTFDQLVFMADEDRRKGASADSTFSNIELYDIA